MKKVLHTAFLIGVAGWLQAQITTPALVANFGVDADMRSNYYNGFLSAGNDDWFGNGDPGPGTFIIDTTGATYIRHLYITQPGTRSSPLFRGMRYPQFSVVNGMMLIDGIFIRDHHGDDSTVFASGSNKNGMSPEDWSCPVSQGIPDKNDILDMAMHVRRAGPNSNDPLWMFGALSLDNTTGNRYFDFEMYQTDIVYDRPSLSFTGYGPDYGHTTWEFDLAGNVTKVGDIIFTAEYSSSSLSSIVARIWINKADLLKTPVAFDWGSEFDGANAGATHGYASIVPKTPGDFYTGLQCSNNTWGGPFGIVLQDNSLATNYSARQLMEFSVNLSKLGLDPLVNVGDPCQMPFRRILVKSRASTSFTAELKDFVGPFDFFRAPAAGASSDVPYFCGTSEIRTISVDNPHITSLYTWTTPDGNIMGSNVGPEIQVNMPGTYIVSQELMDSCGSTYATDTVLLLQNPACIVLNTELLSFSAKRIHDQVSLDWIVEGNDDALYFVMERSADNVNYQPINKQFATGETEMGSYSYTDNPDAGKNVFYRLKLVDRNGNSKYSKVVVVSPTHLPASQIQVFPNPAGSHYSIVITSSKQQQAVIMVADISGRVVENMVTTVPKGTSLVKLVNPDSRPPGTYLVRVNLEEETFSRKMILLKN